MNDTPPLFSEPSPPAAPRRRVVLPYILLAIALVTFFSGPLFFLSLILPAGFKEDKTVIIPRGSSVQTISTILEENGVLIHPMLLRLSARLMAKDRLVAGEYVIKTGMNVLDITTLLREGKTVLRQITVPEGLTSYEIVSLLQAAPALSGKVSTLPAEGSLWPETYRYDYGDDRAKLIERMQKSAATALSTLWETRREGLPLRSAQDALILASIVEKETGKKAQERPLVASVFINRLRLGMPLQSDPTVIYALTGGAGSLGRALTRADWLTPSPYNTYAKGGLPPTPICNPGREALEAVLNPQDSAFLYFVADGSGGHAFAQTLSEHNKNVAHWQSLTRP